jgi:hypothetical protein
MRRNGTEPSRREIVASMTDAGMSTRAIGAALAWRRTPCIDDRIARERH